MKKMYNYENLTARKLNSEEAAVIGRKGGVASGAARRRKKELSESLNVLLQLNIKDERAKEELRAAGFKDDKMINLSYLGYRMFKMALGGNVEAFREIKKLSEETEKEEQENESLNAFLAYDAERAQEIMKQYAESMNLRNCGECARFDDIKQKAKELRNTLESGDDKRLREAAKEMIRYIETQKGY
jgi:hypothetical protein